MRARTRTRTPAAPRRSTAVTHEPIVVVPSTTPKRFFGRGITGEEVAKLNGKLIVVEGADGSGRSTQISKLVEWLEGTGHATLQVEIDETFACPLEPDHVV